MANEIYNVTEMTKCNELYFCSEGCAEAYMEEHLGEFSEVRTEDAQAQAELRDILHKKCDFCSIEL